MTTEEKYRFILSFENGAGTREELENKITTESFEEFSNVGIIKQGLDGSWIRRWQVTSFGRSQMREYMDLCDMRNELNEICLTYGIHTN